MTMSENKTTDAYCPDRCSGPQTTDPRVPTDASTSMRGRKIDTADGAGTSPRLPVGDCPSPVAPETTEQRYSFYEDIKIPGESDLYADSCEVYADKNGHFLYVETDAYEGCAMMSLPCAVKVHRALGKAIRAAKEAARAK